MKAGKGETKIGKGFDHNPLDTVVKAFQLVFFNEKALMSIMLNRKHTVNIFMLYIVTLFIPFKGVTGLLQPTGAGQIVESVLLTSIYICLIYLYMPKKKGVFMATVRVMLAIEVISAFLPLTFMMDDEMLKYFHPGFLAWYLSLSVLCVSKIKGFGYILSSLIVISAFIVTVLFPAFFA